MKTRLLALLYLATVFHVSGVLACTSFGAITASGTVLAKNRDFLYGVQRFERVYPLRQFSAWYGNPYGHHNSFFALTARNDISFGVNEAGLAAIEEDPPKIIGSTQTDRKYMQPYQGYAEGMVMYGILQNFNSIDELMPYLDPIFSVAAPNYYQIADPHKMLTVEVAYGDTNDDPKRKYVYTVLDKIGQSFVHTNSYLSPVFQHLNHLPSEPKSVTSAANRLNVITQKMNAAKGDFNGAFSWFLDTKSDAIVPDMNNSCQNSSLFRSYLPNLTGIKPNMNYDDYYGSVSSFMLKRDGMQTVVYVRIIDAIQVLENGDQRVQYRELTMPLHSLFENKPLDFKVKTFVRPAPLPDGTCP